MIPICMSHEMTEGEQRIIVEETIHISAVCLTSVSICTKHVDRTGRTMQSGHSIHGCQACMG